MFASYNDGSYHGDIGVVIDTLYIARYYKLDVTKNLRNNLSHKTVMEYPVLHVCVADKTPTEYVVYDPAVDTGEMLCSD